MPSTGTLRFLRPYLSSEVLLARKSSYIRFFKSTRCLAESKGRSDDSRAPKSREKSKNTWRVLDANEDRASIEARIKELDNGNALSYPRVQRPRHAVTLEEYQRRYGAMTAGEKRPSEAVVVCGKCVNGALRRLYADFRTGRVNSLRIAGKNLFFVDIQQDGRSLQIICMAQELNAFTGLRPIEFQRFYKLLRRGDIVCEYLASDMMSKN